jgi:hypothetical protein
MSYRILRQRVLQAERDFEVAVARTGQSWVVLKRTLTYAMTPARILATGFGAGLLTGLAAPLAKLGGGTRLVQFITSVIALVGATEAKDAAEEATEAADTATDTAYDVATVADPEATAQAVADKVVERQAGMAPPAPVAAVPREHA